VDKLQALARSRLPLRTRALAGQARAFQAPHDLPQALWLLGMLARVVIQKPRIVIEKCHALSNAGSGVFNAVCHWDAVGISKLFTI
jgi:hypothetical protein